MKTKHKHNIIAALAILTSIIPARAGTPTPELSTPPPAGANLWEFRVGLPGWISGIEGEAGAFGAVNPVDVAFKDVLPLIDMAAALSFEARKGRWGILTSGLYMDLSDAAGTPGPLVDSLSIEVQQLMLDAAVSYAVVDGENCRVELLAGARYNYINIGLELTGLVNASTEGSKEWLDPYVGVLGRAKLSDKTTLVGKGDIGGFDVGSELTWQVYGGLEFQLSPHWHLGIGYRYLSVDYTSGGFTYDVNTSGPQIEFGLKF